MKIKLTVLNIFIHILFLQNIIAAKNLIPMPPPIPIPQIKTYTCTYNCNDGGEPLVAIFDAIQCFDATDLTKIFGAWACEDYGGIQPHVECISNTGLHCSDSRRLTPNSPPSNDEKVDGPISY